MNTKQDVQKSKTHAPRGFQTRPKATGLDRWSQWRKTIVCRPPALSLSGSVSYTMGWAAAVPTNSGVYFIHDLRGPLYIGRSDNLNARYQQHYASSHNRELRTALRAPVGPIQFSWVVASPAEAELLERQYIKAFQPITNAIRYNTSTKEGH